MEKFSRHFSAIEYLLPLIFFSGTQVFFAAAFAPLAAGLMLILLELLRRGPLRITAAFYGIGLIVLGLAGWYGLGLAPYWVWSAHILVAESARQPSEAQRKKPFLFGFKKYSVRRLRETALILAAGLAAAYGIDYLRCNAAGVSVWCAAAFAFIPMQILLNGLERKKT